MDGERDRIMEELRRHALAPRNRRIDDRVRLLNEVLERQPPKTHAYPMLSLMMVVEYVVGIALVLLALTLFSIAVAAPTQAQYLNALPSDGGPRPDVLPPDPIASTTRTLDYYGAAFSLVTGLAMLIGAQITQLMLDIQGNQDRHSFALHGLFNLLLSDRKELVDEHTN